MNINFKKLNRGFTFVEMLIGVAVFIVIALVVTLFAKNIWSYNSSVFASLTGTDTGRQTLKVMVAEIRTTSTADTGAYPIDQASATSFTFYSDIDDDALKEKVRYFVSGTTLQKGVIKPTGSPLTYNAQNEVLTTLMQSLTSSSVFAYYDKNYDGTTAALSAPVDIPLVRLIKITIVTDQDTNRPPAAMTFSSQVSIRNLKDNL